MSVKRLTAVAALFMLCTAHLVHAAEMSGYPNKPIRMLIGFPPGGGADIAARTLAPRLTERLQQQIIVDNRAGASGNIATELTINARPDGYTILFSTIGAVAVNQSLYAGMKFDPAKDLAPVSRVVDSTNVLVVHPSLPVRSVQELIALGRKSPLNGGSSAIGGAGHLANELFNIMTGTKITNVPYKGGGPAMVDLVAGQVQLMFATSASAIPYINAGRLRAIAVTTAERTALLPDLPTVAEAGVKGFEANNWYGVLAPLDTPRAVVERLNREFVAVLGLPDIRAALQKQGLDPTPGTPDEFGAYIKTEVTKWAGVVKAAHIKVE